VAAEHVPVPGASGDSGLHILHFAEHDHGRANDARCARRVYGAERNDDVHQRGTEHGGDGNCEQDTGKRHQRVVGAHHHVVDAAVIASERAGHGAGDGVDPNRGAADQHRQSGAPDDTGEKTATEIVSTEEMVEAGREESCVHVDLVGIDWSEHWGKDGGDDDAEEDKAADEEPVMEEALQRECARASPGPLSVRESNFGCDHDVRSHRSARADRVWHRAHRPRC
jgi:hypothetical protein